MRIWGKLYKGDKLIRNTLFESERGMSAKDYLHDLQEVCYLLDVSTPVSLPTHYKHFVKFRRIKYIPRDFIEDVDFTSFVLELIVDKK